MTSAKADRFSRARRLLARRQEIRRDQPERTSPSSLAIRESGRGEGLTMPDEGPEPSPREVPVLAIPEQYRRDRLVFADLSQSTATSGQFRSRPLLFADPAHGQINSSA